jgi:hypothetical protein
MARDRVSPVGLEGRSEVEVDWRASAEWLKYEVPVRYVGGTTVPEPDVSSESTAEVVSMAGIVISVTEDKEWKVDCSPLVLAPEEKKASSDTEATDSEPKAQARDLPARQALGGDVTMISHPSVGPLDIVTGEPSPMMVPASPKPKPNPGHASLARHRADSIDSNSSARLVMDVVRRSELLRVSCIQRRVQFAAQRGLAWSRGAS